MKDYRPQMWCTTTYVRIWPAQPATVFVGLLKQPTRCFGCTKSLFNEAFSSSNSSGSAKKPSAPKD